MIVIDSVFSCRYESLTFSYPIVEKDGLAALVDLLSNAWNGDKSSNMKMLFPSFFREGYARDDVVIRFRCKPTR